MATTEILQFAGGGGANVLTQAEYAVLAAVLADGYTSGILDSNLLNKTLRQSNFIAAGIAGLLVARGVSVPDDGNLAALITNLGNNLAGIPAPTVLNVSSPVPIGAVNGLVVVNAAGATVQTLPAANAVPAGARVSFFNINAGTAAVTRAGADTITVNSATVTAMSIGLGDTLDLVSNGVNGWYAADGSAQLGNSAAFGASLVASGYQKLPGGLIMQWGSAVSSGGGTSVVTFPLQFPSLVLSLVTGVNSGNYTVPFGAPSTTGFTATTELASNGAGTSGVTYNYIAVGK